MESALGSVLPLLGRSTVENGLLEICLWSVRNVKKLFREEILRALLRFETFRFLDAARNW